MDNSDKSIHDEHRKRMKESYIKSGFDGFSDVEKLEFILFFAIPRKDTNPIAHKLLNKFGSIDQVLEAPIEVLKTVPGMGEHSAILLSTFLRVTSAYGKSKCESFIKGTISAKEYCKNLFHGKGHEEFYLICLTPNNRIISCSLASKGTVSEVPVNMRDLTNITLRNNCDRIIICHNHPLGHARPSDEDISFTSKIVTSCILNSIEVLDHIIVAGDEAFSFEESKILKELKASACKANFCSRKDSAKFGQESTNYTVGK